MQDLKRTMKPFGRSCSFVSGSTLAASTVPRGTTAAPGSSFPSLSEPPQTTQTLGMYVQSLQLLSHAGLWLALLLWLTLFTVDVACRCMQWIPGCWNHLQQACICCQAADAQWLLRHAGQPVQLGHKCVGQSAAMALRLDKLAQGCCQGPHLSLKAHGGCAQCMLFLWITYPAPCLFV